MPIQFDILFSEGLQTRPQLIVNTF